MLNKVTMFNEEKENKLYDYYNYNSSFNGKIISNLYSNLNSLNIFELLKLSRISSTKLSPGLTKGIPDNAVIVIEIGW